MPIHCPVELRSLGPDEFEKLDYRIMGYAYASQNDLGRLCDECAYQADLKARLLGSGFRSVHTEVPVTVVHRNFVKRYFLDMLADDALYELKADADLVGEHEAQLLNYLFVLGTQRGKLLNFRPGKVQGRMVATSLTPDERRRFTTITEHWTPLTPACTTLHQTFRDLLEDWGAFLDLGLYHEALIHFLGGPARVEQCVRLARGGLELGSQRLLLHAPGVAFRLTAFTQGQNFVESHLCRLLALTNLKAIQWINLNHARIELKTLIRSEESRSKE